MACSGRRARARATLLCALAAANCAGCPSTTLWLDDAARDAGIVSVSDNPNRDATAAPANAPPVTSGASAVSPPTAANGGNGALQGAPVAAGGAPSPPPSAAGAGGDGAWDSDAGATDPGDLSPHPTRVPSVNGSCPKLTANGRYTFRDSTGRSLSVQIYIAADAPQKPAPGGPLILYFHGIGSTPSEVVSAFTQASIDAVVAQGGVVASFESTVCVSCLLDDQQVIWYEQDAPVVDQVVACALAQARVDPRRIHALGFSAGAMYTIYLALARADYLASVMSYSGGLSDQSVTSQDPSNHVPALLSYGRMDLDVVVINFAAQSVAWYDQYHPLGYYSLMCDHGGSHMIAPELAPLGLRFFLDHPYRVSPEPYAASIPSVFPSYCHDAPPNR